MKSILILFTFTMTFSYVNVMGQIICIDKFEQNNSLSSLANNLINNGGFENSNCIPNNFFSNSFCPNSNYYTCDIVSWTCTGGGISTYANIVDFNESKIAEGTKALYFGNDICKSCSTATDDTSCLGNTSFSVSGIPMGYPISKANYGGINGLSIEQNVNGLTIGNTYVLEFWAGGEAPTPNPGLFATDIGFGNIFFRCKATDILTGVGTRYIIIFKAVSTSHLIKFTNWGHISTYSTELTLDDVKLYSYNELPSSITNCLSGLNDKMFSNQIILYPNPASEKISIKINTNAKNVSFFISNQLGEKVIQGKLNKEENLVELSSLENGIYFLTIGDFHTQTHKIIKL